MTEVIQRFATSPERVEILKGLLGYRGEIRALGFQRGYQWLAGSFVEDCEGQRQRAPGDVDIVTFAFRPLTVGTSQDLGTLIANNWILFDPDLAKATFKCDAYFIDLNKPAHLIVDDAVYFNSLFSHQRGTSLWKGILRVDLQSDDAAAITLI